MLNKNASPEIIPTDINIILFTSSITEITIIFQILGKTHGLVSKNIDKQSPNKNIFEIGCGNGKNMLYAKNNGHRVTGIDLCSKLC